MPVFLAGVAALAFVGARHTVAGRRLGPGQQRKQDYLRDHLAGSDVGIRAVGRLAGAATPEIAAVCCQMYDEFRVERRFLSGLLQAEHGSPMSLKRLLGRVGGQLASAPLLRQPVEGLRLFRALEALMIGIQGKRLLWRVLAQLEPAESENRQDLLAFEQLAIDQWTRLERLRLQTGDSTFARFSTHLSPSPR